MDKTKFRLLFEDKNIRAFYKPSGMHSISLKNSIESAVSTYEREYGKRGDIDGGESGLLYRLDKKTSGIIVFARNNECFNTLFRSGLTKYYKAISHSSFEPLKGILDADGYEDLRQKLDKDGKLEFTSYFRNYDTNSAFVRPVFENQLSHYKDKKVSNSAYTTFITKKSDTEFECKITRGYRHQIRSTLSSLFYPIDGDINYGSKIVLDDDSIALVCQRVGGEYSGVKYNLDLAKL